MHYIVRVQAHVFVESQSLTELIYLQLVLDALSCLITIIKEIFKSDFSKFELDWRIVKWRNAVAVLAEKVIRVTVPLHSQAIVSHRFRNRDFKYMVFIFSRVLNMFLSCLLKLKRLVSWSLDHTKQAAILLMTRHTPKGKQTPRRPAYVPPRAAPLRSPAPARGSRRSQAVGSFYILFVVRHL